VTTGGPSRRQDFDGAGLLAAIACCALWGGNAIAVKAAVPSIPAFGCAGLRFLLSLPVLAAVCRVMGQPLTVPKGRWGLVLVHAVVTVTQIGMFNWGTSHSLAGRSSILINIHPLVVAPLAWPFLGERLGWRGWLGLASAGLGVLLLMVGRGGGGGLTGDLVVIASGVVFALQTIAQKKTFPIIPPTTLLLWQSIVALPMFLAYSAIVEGLDSYHFTPNVYWGVLYQGLAVSGFCFTTWMLLLRTYPAGRLATVAFLTPLFGIALGNLVRGEDLTRPLLLGGALVGSGIYLAASDRVAHHVEPDIGLPGDDAP
jgi:drug/metabolite transporter (DMT)-like permease